MKQYAIIKAFSSGLPTQAEPPENIQWAPPGKHAISATRGDKPVKMTVDVTSDAVAALNESLEEIRGSGHNPYIDFNHGGWGKGVEAMTVAWMIARTMELYQHSGSTSLCTNIQAREEETQNQHLEKIIITAQVEWTMPQN